MCRTARIARARSRNNRSRRSRARCRDFQPLLRQTVLKVPLLAALPGSRPLAGTRRISFKHLANDPLSVFPRRGGSGFDERIMGVCHKAGFTPGLLDGEGDWDASLAGKNSARP